MNDLKEEMKKFEEKSKKLSACFDEFENKITVLEERIAKLEGRKFKTVMDEQQKIDLTLKHMQLDLETRVKHSWENRIPMEFKRAAALFGKRIKRYNKDLGMWVRSIDSIEMISKINGSFLLLPKGTFDSLHGGNQEDLLVYGLSDRMIHKYRTEKVRMVDAGAFEKELAKANKASEKYFKKESENE